MGDISISSNGGCSEGGRDHMEVVNHDGVQSWCVVSVLGDIFGVCRTVVGIGHLSSLSVDDDAFTSLAFGNSIP